MTSRSSLLRCVAMPCTQPNCWVFEWERCTEAPELLMNWPESRPPDAACTSTAFPRGPQSLEESTTMGSVLGSISASIMEIFRMSDTEGLSSGEPELDSGMSLAAASPLVKACEAWLEPPKVILVTVALWVMIGCCVGDDTHIMLWWQRLLVLLSDVCMLFILHFTCVLFKIDKRSISTSLSVFYSNYSLNRKWGKPQEHSTHQVCEISLCILFTKIDWKFGRESPQTITGQTMSGLAFTSCPGRK